MKSLNTTLELSFDKNKIEKNYTSNKDASTELGELAANLVLSENPVGIVAGLAVGLFGTLKDFANREPYYAVSISKKLFTDKKKEINVVIIAKNKNKEELSNEISNTKNFRIVNVGMNESGIIIVVR